MKKPYIENRKTVFESIKESIQHWIDDKIKPLEKGGDYLNTLLYMGAEICPLCRMYYKDSPCKKCPLHRAGQNAMPTVPLGPNGIPHIVLKILKANSVPLTLWFAPSAPCCQNQPSPPKGVANEAR